MRDRRPDWPAIARLVDDWRPDLLVVGLPAAADGAEHVLAAPITRFARRLEGRFHIRVAFVDEYLSSHAAAADEAETRRAGLDAVAARVILETWLAEQGQRATPP